MYRLYIIVLLITVFIEKGLGLPIRNFQIIIDKLKLVIIALAFVWNILVIIV